MKGDLNCVEQLANLVRLSMPATDRYDWPAIEDSLGGLSLPSDYKVLIESFPKGRFQELVTVIRPGDVNSPKDEYLGYYAHPGSSSKSHS